MGDDARPKRARLANLGARKHVAKAGIAAILKELKEGEIPEASSIRSIGRVRDEAIDAQTPYGQPVQHMYLNTIMDG